MSGWILSVVGIVLLSVLLDILLPKGQTSKYIKGIFSIVTIYVIISPLPSLIKGADFEGLFGFEQTIAADGEFVDSIYEADFAERERKTEEILKLNGYSGAEVDIVAKSGEKNEIDYVNVDISKLSINENTLNIDILKIKESVADYLGVSITEVRIIGNQR